MDWVGGKGANAELLPRRMGGTYLSVLTTELESL